MSSVLKPLSSNDILRKYFDHETQKAFKLLIRTIIFPQLIKEKFTKKNKYKIIYPLEFIEEHLAAIFDAHKIGDGSYPVDIKIKDEFLDIKVVQAKLKRGSNELANSESGESSLGQKFENFGRYSLDELFKRKMYSDICTNWKDVLINKYNLVINDYGNMPISYLFVIKCNNYFLISVFNLNKDYVDNVCPNIEKTEMLDKNVSLILDNFIDDKYGSSKIYKSKKRLELRLRPKNLLEDGYALKVNTNFQKTDIDINDVSGTNNEESILDLLYKEMLKIDINFEVPRPDKLLV